MLFIARRKDKFNPTLIEYDMPTTFLPFFADYIFWNIFRFYFVRNL